MNQTPPKAGWKREGRAFLVTDSTTAAAQKRRRDARDTGINFLLALPTAGYLGLLGAIASASSEGPEHAWWSTANLYLPQWPWAIPAFLLAFATVCFVRCKTRLQRWGWASAQLLPVFWVAGPMMGFVWHTGATKATKSGFSSAVTLPSAVTLRVMTYNIAGGKAGTDVLVRAVETAHPDLVLIQERGQGDMEAGLKFAYPSWFVQASGEFLVASRFPLGAATQQTLALLASDPEKSPGYLRCQVKISPSHTVTVYNVHLSTPRPAMDGLRFREPGSVGALESNTRTRLIQGAQIADAVRGEAGPLLVAGDFNAPLPSLICRLVEHAGMRDAFAEVGQGYGYTTGYEIKPHIAYARIDHIMASRQWQIENCFAGSGDASDHRPVVADFSLPAAP